MDQRISSSDNQSHSDSSSSSSSIINGGRWTPEEHSQFLHAIEKYGKDWRMIAQEIPTRATSQIRSHAQKYYNKLQSNQTKIGNNKHQIIGSQKDKLSTRSKFERKESRQQIKKAALHKKDGQGEENRNSGKDKKIKKASLKPQKLKEKKQRKNIIKVQEACRVPEPTNENVAPQKQILQIDQKNNQKTNQKSEKEPDKQFICTEQFLFKVLLQKRKNIKNQKKQQQCKIETTEPPKELMKKKYSFKKYHHQGQINTQNIGINTYKNAKEKLKRRISQNNILLSPSFYQSSQSFQSQQTSPIIIQYNQLAQQQQQQISHFQKLNKYKPIEKASKDKKKKKDKKKIRSLDIIIEQFDQNSEKQSKEHAKNDSIMIDENQQQIQQNTNKYTSFFSQKIMPLLYGQQMDQNKVQSFNLYDFIDGSLSTKKKDSQ